ncbi:hypothetical protein [Francisella hispaniensis]|uniref:hypothetical protein n=1 Tax=Francisella hispaniensis TaxID=622488 RepID=UPI0007A9CFF0|nr:hypothetical protein [Francisella hispaniensis]KYW88423.1 hypothetical protein AUF42_00025 [Francisella hispaniensis FSC454]MBK2357791.1 hypothetical protein [Francisella hispaniensis]
MKEIYKSLSYFYKSDKCIKTSFLNYMNDEEVIIDLVKNTKSIKDFVFLYNTLVTYNNLYFQKVKILLLNLIKKPSDFIEIYTKINDDHKSVFFRFVKGKLVDYNATFCFFKIYRKLFPDDKNDYFLASIDKIVEETTNIIDFDVMYNSLSSHHKSLYFHKVKQKLVYMSNNLFNFKDIYIILEAHHKNEFVQRVKHRFVSLTTSINDFFTIFDCLYFPHNYIYTESTYLELVKLIHNLGDYKDVCSILNASQQKEFSKKVHSSNFFDSYSA